MSDLKMNINDFVTEQVQAGAYQMEQTGEYKKIHNEYMLHYENLKDGLSEDKKELLEKIIQLINVREFIAREQSYKQGLKDGEIIQKRLFGGYKHYKRI